MKTYFKLLFTAILISFSSSVLIAQDTIKEEEKLEILITKTTTKPELEKIVKDLGEKGIDMVITEVKYNSRERVVNIKGEINCNDGNTGSFEAARLKKILIIRDYSASAEKPFQILIN